MTRIVHLHGLESTVDEDLVPIGGKARLLREHFGDDVDLVRLDTSAAVAVAHRVYGQTGDWTWPYDGYEQAFATPLARARAAITPDTRVIVGSSFGGAVLLRLLHEAPHWRGACVFLAGAGPKLTPHRTLPAGVPCLLAHGTRDTVVPYEDSVTLANSSPDAELRTLDDTHPLGSLLDGGLLELVEWGLTRGRDAAAGATPR